LTARHELHIVHSLTNHSKINTEVSELEYLRTVVQKLYFVQSNTKIGHQIVHVSPGMVQIRGGDGFILHNCAFPLSPADDSRVGEGGDVLGQSRVLEKIIV